MIVPSGLSASIKAEEKTAILDKCKEISASLKAAGLRVELDDRDNYTAGWKYNHWELKGKLAWYSSLVFGPVV